MRRKGHDEDEGWRERMLTREDVGYGPARPYEYGPGMRMPRERRASAGRDREEPEPATPGAGPYQARLRRRQRPDSWIQADVEEALFLDTWVDADRITVNVEGGVVTLIGTLPDREEVRRAIDDANRIPGVRRVRDRLEVSP